MQNSYIKNGIKIIIREGLEKMVIEWSLLLHHFLSLNSPVKTVKATSIAKLNTL